MLPCYLKIKILIKHREYSTVGLKGLYTYTAMLCVLLPSERILGTPAQLKKKDSKHMQAIKNIINKHHNSNTIWYEMLLNVIVLL